MRRVAASAGAVAALGASIASCDAGGVSSPASGASVSPDASATSAGDASVVDAGPIRAPYGLDVRPSNTSCRAPARPPPAVPVAFVRVYSNLDLGLPMNVAQRPGDGSRWYVADRAGRIAWFSSQSPAALTTAADLAVLARPVGGCLDKPCVETFGEGGFLGFAFHPRFAQNGKAYVSFTAPQWTNPYSTMRSVLAEITSTDGGDTFTAYRTLLWFDQEPEKNHKGGGLAFGPDGYLYASFGDGGAIQDAFLHGQRKDDFFSKVLRLDVDGPRLPGKEYGVPPDNPFRTGGGAPEVFAYGFRNPFRLSVDRESGEVWVGDVGETSYEEINRVELGGNYGWSCREGAHDFLPNDPNRCPNGPANTIDPVVEHAHAPPGGRSITGGVVYRGKAIPGFAGTYVYGDYVRQELWALTFDEATGAPSTRRLDEQAGPQASWVSFAEDADGEIYGVALDQGAMYKLVPAAPAAPDPFPRRLSETGCVDPQEPTRPAAGVIPFGVNAPLWSDGAEKHRWLALPDGAKVSVKADGDLDLPAGSVVVKTFELAGRLVETRLLVRHADGGWAGYTYEWNDPQTDAVLLAGSKTKRVGPRTWTFPSRAECARCHTEAAGFTLGLELGQLDGDLVYPSTNRIANQLATLDHVGLFDPPLTQAPPVRRIPAPTGSAPLADRARAYLHANCSQCHRPQGGGGAGAGIDLRYATPFVATGTCDAGSVSGALSVPGAKIVSPGKPGASLVSVRMRASGAYRMPPLGTRVVDTEGAALIDAWIAALGPCP